MAEWNEWKAKHGKTYNSPEEEENRKKVFMENKALIEEHNAKYEKGEVTYTMGLNQFSDQTQDEFKNRFRSCPK